MDDSAIRETRQALRRVQQHLSDAHENLGAKRKTVGLVEIVHHPTSKLRILNYITPRKSTAWVSSKEIAQGIEQLRELDRIPRVCYIEGLFPPMFAKSLHELGLRVEQETPIMLYHPKGGILRLPKMPDGLVLMPVEDQRGSELWWYVWRNAYYDVLTIGVEPLYVGRDMREIATGNQIDILAYRQSFPIGVVRVTIQGETAHITALALMKDVRTPEMTGFLLASALQAAIDRKCTLIFAPGETEQDRRLCRQLGFVDSGSIVCYAEQPNTSYGEADDSLAQSVLTLR